MKTFYKTSIIIFWLSLAYSSTAQVFRGVIIDADNQTPLAFCHVQNDENRKVSLTNEDGTFQIPLTSLEDTLSISFIGYFTLKVAAKDFPKNRKVALKSSSIQVNEMVVTTDDYLYKLISKTRKKLLKNQLKPAQTYMQVETMLQNANFPVEMIQAYYNTYFDGIKIDKMYLKSGRVGLAAVDSTTFVNIGTSQALAKLSLLIPSDDYPDNPFQFNERRLKSKYRVQKLASMDNGQIVQIAFEPKKKGKGFSGEMWIHEKSGALLKIVLTQEDVKKHPFQPLHPGSRIEEVGLTIEQTFQFDGKNSQLSHINLNYEMVFMHYINSAFKRIELKAEGLLHFYENKDLLVLPYFRYENRHNDYRKMSLVPYNEVFWKNNEGLVLSKEERKKLAFFNEGGFLLNFSDSFMNDKPFFEFNNIFWSKDRRIRLKDIKKPKANRYTLDQRPDFLPQSTTAYLDPDDFTIQLYLDVNAIKDTLHYHSATIFDVFKTYSDHPKSKELNCLMNILFDLHEIERRKMMKELKTQNFTTKQADKIYKKTKTKLETMQRKIFTDIKGGKNMKALRKWNDKVVAELDVDNITLFKLEELD